MRHGSRKRTSRETGPGHGTVVKDAERMEKPVVATRPAAEEAGGA